MPPRGPSRALLYFSLILSGCVDAGAPGPVAIDGAQASLPIAKGGGAARENADPQRAAAMWRDLPPRFAPAGAAPFDLAGLHPEEARPLALDEQRREPIVVTDAPVPPGVDPNSLPPPVQLPTLAAHERVVPPPTLDLLELLDPGSEPRELLRVSAEPGEVERVQLDLIVTIDAGAESGPPPVIPPMRFLASKKITSRTSDGYELEIALEKFDILAADGSDPALASATSAAMKGIEQHTMLVRTTDRGRITAETIAVPEGVTEQAAESFRGFTDALMRTVVTYPEEAVGVGARWSTSEAISENGVSLAQKNVYELTGRQDGLVSIAVTTTRTPRQEFVTPNHAPPGLRLHIVDLASTGGGSLELEPGSFGARAGTIDSRTQIEVEILQDEEVLQRIESVMTTTIKATTR